MAGQWVRGGWRSSWSLAATEGSGRVSAAGSASSHNPVIDSNGWIWGTCAETRAWDEVLSASPIRLFKYHPEGKRFVWFDFGLSRKAETKQLLPDPEKPNLVAIAKAVRRLGARRGDVQLFQFAVAPHRDGHRLAGIEAYDLLHVLEALDLSWADLFPKGAKPFPPRA